MSAPSLPTPAGPVRREAIALARLAAPLVGGNLLQMAIYSVDVLFVARLGPVPFAAATLGVYLYSLIFFPLSGLVGAAAPLIAAELGRRRHAVREVRRSFRMALWLCAAATVPATLVMWHGERLLLWGGQDPQVAALAGGFLRVLVWGLFPFLAAGVMRAAAAALGRPGYALLVSGAGLGVSLLANWLLVFGHGGFPALGLTGSALASLSTSIAVALAFAAVFAFDRRLARRRLFGRWWRGDPARFAAIVRLGAPIALQGGAEAGLFAGSGFLMGLIGVTEVAANAVALNVAAVTFQLALGVSQAATIRVGLAYGARDRAGIARAGWTAFALGLGLMSLCALALLANPGALVALFLDAADPANARAAELAGQFLLLAAAFQLFDGAQAVAAGILRGLQDTRAPMLIALVGYWVVGFGTAIGLGFGLGWAGVGIWTGLLAGLAAVGAALVWRWTARDRLALAPLASEC